MCWDSFLAKKKGITLMREKCSKKIIFPDGSIQTIDIVDDATQPKIDSILSFCEMNYMRYPSAACDGCSSCQRYILIEASEDTYWVEKIQ